ncbi:MAG: hypothetical protein FJ387_09015 [Verrucomicrobia bacterium]|nr:hypothetical protein [Verrucomicrobiota bacterium]
MHAPSLQNRVQAGVSATFLSLLLCACQSNPERDFYIPHTYQDRMPSSTSQVRLQQELAAEKKSRSEATPAPALVLMLVAHDAAGKPVLAEVRSSSGYPEIDERAVAWALAQRNFPVGEANTVLIAIDPKALPKPAPARSP